MSKDKSKTQRILAVVTLTSALAVSIVSVYSAIYLPRAVVKPEVTTIEPTTTEIPSDLQFTSVEVLSAVHLETTKTPKLTVTPKPTVKPTVKPKAVSKAEPDFKFPKSVSKGAQKYLKEAYKQAYSACKGTAFPDPFMAMSLSVVEKPVENDEVFLIPLVYQDTLDRALAKSDGDYSEAIKHSSDSRSYKTYACVGPLQMAPGWVSCKPRNPTVWKDSCQMFYGDAENAIPGLKAFAKKCDIKVTDTLLRTLVAMRHNVGNLADWSRLDPDSSTGRSFIPFKTKRAVFKWNAAVASKDAQKAIKKAAYKSYKTYIKTGNYENQGISWHKIAKITGYSESNITSEKEWWRPQYSVRFWYNYYQLRLLYGVDTAETLGIN